MSEAWTMSVDGRLYGPYSALQMQSFRAEGRLAAHSLVARAGEEQFRPAAEYPELESLFAPAQPVQETPVSEVQVPVQPEEPAPHKFGRSNEAENVERTHFVIIADMKSRSIAGLEEEIFNLGPACRFMPQAWILTSAISVNTVRHALVQKLGKLDQLFIVDTAHDKAAWFNFGPETDTRVRRMWQKDEELSGPGRVQEHRASRRAS
jgi:hypothetical protein